MNEKPVSKNKFGRILRIRQLAFILITIFIFGFQNNVVAQENGWGNPINLTNTPTNSILPSLAVDVFGNVHIVWIEEIEPGITVAMYSRLSEEGWSTPIDIFASNGNGQIDKVLLLGDTEGNLHILFGRNGIQYSRALAEQAGSAQNWLPPETVVKPVNNMTYHNAVIDSENRLHMVYGIANGPGSGVYYISSTDSVETWNETSAVYINPSPNLTVNIPMIAVSQSGKIHIVWSKSNYPETFPPTGIQYSSSLDGKIWEPAISLAEGPYADATLISIGNGEVHVVWSGTDVDRFKFHKYSIDDGNTWTDTWKNSELGGLQGLPALVFDSLDRVYWLKVGTVFGMPVSSGQNQDSLHENIFIDGSWDSGQILLPSSYADQNQANVTAAISNGNELHIAVMNPLNSNGGDYQFDIYYLRKLLDSPKVISQPVIIETPTSQSLPTATLESYPGPTNTPFSSSPSGIDLSFGSMTVIIISVIPALLLVTIVIAITLLRKSR